MRQKHSNNSLKSVDLGSVANSDPNYFSGSGFDYELVPTYKKLVPTYNKLVPTNDKLLPTRRF